MSNVIPIPKVTYKNAGSLIKEVALDSSRVIVTTHCSERMAERGVTMTQLLRCLRVGQEVDIELDGKTGCFKVSFEIRSAGVRVKVVAALDEEEDGAFVIAVTAITRKL